MNKSQQIDYFHELSTLLTGYDLVTLHGTGMGDLYLKSLQEILGEALVEEFLGSFFQKTRKFRSSSIGWLKNILHLDLADLGLQIFFLEDDKWGPICRNIIKMWYMGNWYQMPDEWRKNYVSSTLDTTKVLSKEAYIEGLVWKAIGTHPKSAKHPGYGTWQFAPEF